MTRRTALVLLAVLLAIASGAILAVDFWWQEQHLHEGCRLGQPFVFYDAETIARIIADHCKDRRPEYVHFLWTYDFVGPLLFAGCLYLAISLGVAHAWPGAPRAAQLRWVAVAAAVSDYIENALTTVLLLTDPAQHRVLATACGLATLLKWALYGAAGAVALVSLAALGMRRLRAPAGTAGR